MAATDVEANVGNGHNHRGGTTPSELVFKDVSVDIGDKRILHVVSGYVETGTMLALMGPSGAGKTTLLNTLAGRSTSSYSGQISLNDRPVSKQTKRKISYVLQEDILLTNLTVRETLVFTAQLRLPESMPAAEKLKKVDEVIDALDMRKCANTVIGDSFVPGISGGEKKRTSIGCELLTNPVLLMLDEPTTGLDSSTAYNLMKIMKKHMRDSGKMVVASIHQPSSQTFFLFDRVMLLCDGKVAYFGSCADMLDYFAGLGIHNRPNFNPADFMLENIKKDSTKETVMNAAKNFSTQSLNEFKKHRHSADEGSHSESASQLSVTHRDLLDARKLSSMSHDDPYNHDNDKKWPTSFLTQTSVLTRRNFKDSLPKIISWKTALQMLVVSLFYGLLSFQLADSEQAVSDRLGVLFFLNTNWAFRCAFESMLSLSTDKVILNKERASGYYRLSAFYAAKMTSEFPLTLLLPTVSIGITYWMAGLSGYLAFIECWAFLILSCISAQSIGLFVGALVDDPVISSATMTAVIQASMLTGGFFVKVLPDWFVWIKYFSHINYAFGGMVQMEFAEENFGCLPKNSTAYCNTIYKSSNEVYGNATFPGQLVVEDLGLYWPTWLNALMLLVLSLAYRIGAYLILRFVRTPKSS